MKVSFIHTGDLHLGRQFHFKYHGDTFGREKRHYLWQTFEKIIDYAEENAVHFLLITGDLFDSDEVDSAEIARVADRLGELSITQTVIIAGNHDYYGESSPYTMTEWPNNVTILQSGKIESLSFPRLRTKIYGLSWIKDTYSEMPFKGIIESSEDWNQILMLHGDADHQDSMYMPINLNVFSSMDYIALGHIHKPAQCSRKAAYCGSPVPLNFGEKGDHGFIVGELDEGGCTTRFVKLDGPDYISREVEIVSEMSMDDMIRRIEGIASSKSREKDYFRVNLSGYYDLDMDLDWLVSELRKRFYYIEADFSGLKMDLDLKVLAENNRDNVIGHFIDEMQKRKGDPIAEKALYLGLKGLLPASHVIRSNGNKGDMR